MLNGLFASLGAGLISATVFASATTGGLVMRLVLFFLTPLALHLVGLGLGWRNAVIAGAAAAMLLVLGAGPTFGLAYLVTQAVPAALLTYLALLRRDVSGPADAGAGGSAAGVEWYPVGRLVMWTAVIGALLAILMLLVAGGGSDRDALLQAFKAAIGAVLKQRSETGEAASLSDDDLTRIASVALALMPAFSAMSWMLGMLFNLWLAGRVTLASGRLQRPWPDLAAFALPPVAPLALVASIAGSMLAGLGGLAATAAAGAMVFAYLLLGLAIVHFASRTLAWRPFVLWALYAGMAIVPGGPIFVAILGLAESLRPMRKPAGPAPPSNSPPASPGG